MEDCRAKRRDEVYTLVLACVGVAIGLAYWTSRSVPESTSSLGLQQLQCDLNLLSLEELQTLPGVGAETARRIVHYREQVGGFRSVEQLGEVSGIGPGRLSRLRPFLFVLREEGTSDRKDVPTNGRPLSVARTVSASRGPTAGH
jgi:competence ComEA-like helix-hairpin-helix protein